MKWFSSPISTPRFLQNFRIKETSGSDGETSKKEARKSNRWTLLKINIERGTFTGGWTEWSKELDELEGRD